MQGHESRKSVAIPAKMEYGIQECHGCVLPSYKRSVEGKYHMKIVDYRKVPATTPLPGVIKRVPIGPEAGAKNFIMRVFEVAPGHASPDHIHPWEHEIFILSGEGVARSQDGKETPIGEGTTLFIPEGEKHCLVNKGRVELRFICMIPAGVE